MINAKTNENQIYDALCNFKFFASLSVVSWVEKPKKQINMLWNIFSHKSFHDGYRECSKYKMECMKKKPKKEGQNRETERKHTQQQINERTECSSNESSEICFVLFEFWKRFSHNLVIALRWILYWLLVLSVYIIAVSLNRFEQPYVTYIVFALRKKWQYERETFFLNWAMSYVSVSCTHFNIFPLYSEIII